MIKKAAMFGLDARIALAIFGALSVISGAVLFSTIRHIKVVSLVSTAQEYAKAVEAFIIDTGTDLEKVNTTAFKLTDLTEQPAGAPGWKGPYTSLDGDLEVGGRVLKTSKYNLFIRDLESNLGGANYSDPVGCSTPPCFYWIQLAKVADDSIVKAIDVFVDGGDSPDTGDIRILDIDTGANAGVYLRGPIMLSK